MIDSICDEGDIYGAQPKYYSEASPTIDLTFLKDDDSAREDTRADINEVIIEGYPES